MDVFDGYRNVLDSCSDSIGLKGIYTWFAVEEDWEWEDIRGRMTDVGVDVLKISCFFGCCERAEDFAVCGVEGD